MMKPTSVQRAMSLYQIGSFKRGGVLHVDDPTEAFWAELERITTDEWTQAKTPHSSDLDWDYYRRYANVRMVQALEFRNSASTGTLLTQPLQLYYCFLNVVRSLMAVYSEIMPIPRHGLKYVEASDLFEVSAKVIKGTFEQYLQQRGRAVPIGTRFSLGDCLSRIVELARMYRSPDRGFPMVVPVSVSARFSGEIDLTFNPQFIDEADFRSGWRSAFPSLAKLCELQGDTGCVLKLASPISPSEYDDVCAFCERHFMPGLGSIEAGTWYALRGQNLNQAIPRDADYYVAMFILSNLVRYEPEQLVEAARFGTERAWLLRQFLAAAERYFPQLMLSWVRAVPLYASVG